jgi:hypothetical protein
MADGVPAQVLGQRLDLGQLRHVVLVLVFRVSAPFPA